MSSGSAVVLWCIPQGAPFRSLLFLPLFVQSTEVSTRFSLYYFQSPKTVLFAYSPYTQAKWFKFQWRKYLPPWHDSSTHFSQWCLRFSGSVRSGDVCRNVFCGEASCSALRLLRSHQHFWSGQLKAHTRELRWSSWTAVSFRGVTQGFSIVLVCHLVHVGLSLCREVFSIPSPGKAKRWKSFFRKI